MHESCVGVQILCEEVGTHSFSFDESSLQQAVSLWRLNQLELCWFSFLLCVNVLCMLWCKCYMCKIKCSAVYLYELQDRKLTLTVPVQWGDCDITFCTSSYHIYLVGLIQIVSGGILEAVWETVKKNDFLKLHIWIRKIQEIWDLQTPFSWRNSRLKSSGICPTIRVK